MKMIWTVVNALTMSTKVFKRRKVSHQSNFMSFALGTNLFLFHFKALLFKKQVKSGFTNYQPRGLAVSQSNQI